MSDTRFNFVLHGIRRARKQLEALQREVKNGDDAKQLGAALDSLAKADAAIEAQHQAVLKKRWDAIAAAAQAQAARLKGAQP